MKTEMIAEAPSLNFTREQIDQLVESQRVFFESGVTRSYAFRKGQLAVLKAAIKRREKDILNALHQDLRKNEFEAYGTEIGIVYQEISHTLHHLRQWMQPKRIYTPILFAPSSSRIIQDPLGTVLIIGPWNYPFHLVFAPLVAAIAGGNTVILKPSELAPATEAVMASLIEETFEPEYIAVIRGDGQQVGRQLIERHHLDHIFYTGSTAVGRMVMQQAARQLSPVTLELGGKSPCIVDETANMEWAAKKIIWGKLINAGQTCVAPDYLLVQESVKGKLLAAMKGQIHQMFGEDPSQSPDYPRIINQKRFSALLGLLNGVEILHGGRHNVNDLYIEPTLVQADDLGHPIWQEEIFGPILPIRTYRSREEVLEIVNLNPYPLAFYLFTASKECEHYYTQKVRFGGGCINNTLIHLGNPNLPFGGVGYSGMGQYHGEEGFRTFTRQKSLMKTPVGPDVPLWYAPVKHWYLHVLKMLMK